MHKVSLLLTIPIIALTLGACHNSNAGEENQAKQTEQKQQSSNQPQNTGNNNDPLISSNLIQQSGQSEANWYHTNGNNIVKAILKTNGSAHMMYAKGFSNGSDDGNYTWNNKYHQQSSNASNALNDANATNGVISVNDMKNKYYRIGWILSNAQGSVTQDDGNYHGQMTEARYTASINKFNTGKAFIKAHHETKYAVYDDGDNKWFTHKAASLNDPQF